MPIRIILRSAGFCVLLALPMSLAGSVELPTPRPTYTPYPSVTPAPSETPRPTYTPLPSEEVVSTVVPSPVPTAKPEDPFEEFYSGKTRRLNNEAKALEKSGNYADAIVKYKEAIESYGKPSAVMENRIARSYAYLGEFTLAIDHYSNAIEVRDTSINRVSRAGIYLETYQCNLAISDAHVALSLPPVQVDGFHTDMQANYILSICYFYNSEYRKALQHMDARISIALDIEMDAEAISDLQEEREYIFSF